jgi:hypothetical protein
MLHSHLMAIGDGNHFEIRRHDDPNRREAAARLMFKRALSGSEHKAPCGGCA